MTWIVKGTVQGQYATPVTVRVYRLDTGELVGVSGLVTGDYVIIVPEDTAYFLTCTADIGRPWEPGKFRAVGELVFPRNAPAIVPYYFRCTGAGQSGQIDPDFVGMPLVIITDGECEWERVERIPEPLIQFPVLPTLI